MAGSTTLDYKLISGAVVFLPKDTASQTGLGSGLLDATMAAATAYAGQLQAELGSPPGTGLDPRTVLAPEGQAPDGVTCLDHHHKCSHWASQVCCHVPAGPICVLCLHGFCERPNRESNGLEP